MKAEFVAGIITGDSNYVLMPDGSFGRPRLHRSARPFSNKTTATAALIQHLPTFVNRMQARTSKQFIVSGTFFATHSEFELTVDQINARQERRARGV